MSDSPTSDAPTNRIYRGVKNPEPRDNRAERIVSDSHPNFQHLRKPHVRQFVSLREATRALGVTNTDLNSLCEKFDITRRRGNINEYIENPDVLKLREKMIENGLFVRLKVVSQLESVNIEAVKMFCKRIGVPMTRKPIADPQIRSRDLPALQQELRQKTRRVQERNVQAEGTFWMIDGTPEERQSGAEPKKKLRQRKLVEPYITVVQGGLPTLGKGH